MNVAYIGLGSNLGDRERYLMQALERIEKNPEITITKISSIYETYPVGITEQPLFLNMVIEIETNFSPFELLNFLQEIESEFGRRREIKWGPRTLDLDILLYNQENMKSDEIKWGPRTLDLDILLYNQENMKSERLIIPHPRMQERGFVLIPLHEINPALVETMFKNDYEKVKEQQVFLWKQKNDIHVSV